MALMCSANGLKGWIRQATRPFFPSRPKKAHAELPKKLHSEWTSYRSDSDQKKNSTSQLHTRRSQEGGRYVTLRFEKKFADTAICNANK